jgi:hypothetical protein
MSPQRQRQWGGYVPGGPVVSLKSLSGIGVKPPVEPMLAKLGDELPSGDYLYEPEEIVIATARGLDFDALQLRLHPAASRVKKLATETPSSFVAFDVLAAREVLFRRSHI